MLPCSPKRMRDGGETERRKRGSRQDGRVGVAVGEKRGKKREGKMRKKAP